MILDEFKNPQWFKPKSFGYGWTPSNIWGWFTVLGFLVQFLMNLSMIVYINIRTDMNYVITVSIINMIMAISFLLIITYKTSKK
jgi:hypothetical protein